MPQVDFYYLQLKAFRFVMPIKKTGTLFTFTREDYVFGSVGLSVLSFHGVFMKSCRCHKGHLQILAVIWIFWVRDFRVLVDVLSFNMLSDVIMLFCKAEN